MYTPRSFKTDAPTTDTHTLFDEIRQFDPFSDPEDDTTLFSWSIPWADLMMTMFVFFAVLYLFQAKQDHYHRTGSQGTMISQILSVPESDESPPGNPDAGRHAQSLNRIKENKMIRTVNTIELTRHKSVHLSIASDVLFNPGKDKIRESAKAELRDIARVIKETGLVINVAGHTDRMSNLSNEFPTPWDLSAARAVRVARFMTEQCGIPGNRLFLTAYAFHPPASPGTTARNRQVDLLLMKDHPFIGPGIPNPGTAEGEP